MEKFIAIGLISAAIVWVVRYVKKRQELEAVKKWMMLGAENIVIHSTASDESFDKDIKMLQKYRPDLSVYRHLHKRVWEYLEKGKQPRIKDLKHLHRLSSFDDDLSDDERALFPDAAYALGGRKRFFFRKDFTLVGQKDYNREIEETFVRILEQKRLSPEDKNFLQTFCGGFSEEEKRYLSKTDEEGYYGGPGRPYPDMRYYSHGEVGGKDMQLYFNQNFELIAAICKYFQKRPVDSYGNTYSDCKEDVIWEAPGARQRERYNR